jgi:hypothetical protein
VAAHIDSQALLDCYLLDLDATLQFSQRTAAKLERGLAGSDAFSARARDLASATSVTINTARALITEARILSENARTARELLHELRAECEKLRRGLK